MNSPSSVDALLTAVSGFLSEDLLPRANGTEAFNIRVCLRAIGIAQRESKLIHALELAEAERLVALLGTSGTLEELRKTLCDRIVEGKLALEMPELREHLWATILGQVAIDQPTYPTYQAEIRNLAAIS